MSPDNLYTEFAQTGSATIKRSYAKGVVGILFSAALAVGGIFLALTWMRQYPGEWYRFAPFVITLVFGYGAVKTILDMIGGDVVLSTEGIQIGSKRVISWRDIEQIRVEGTSTARNRQAFTAVVKLVLGPGDERKRVDLPSNLTIASVTLGPLIDKCRQVALG